MTTNDELKELIENNLQSTKDILKYYQDSKKVVHIVVKSRRFYNGTILEIRDFILVFLDNKIGEVPIPLKDVYLVELFQEPSKGGEEDGRQ